MTQKIDQESKKLLLDDKEIDSNELKRLIQESESPKSKIKIKKISETVYRTLTFTKG